MEVSGPLDPDPVSLSPSIMKTGPEGPKESSAESSSGKQEPDSSPSPSVLGVPQSTF